MKREHLIPLERSKKIIYLDLRGRDAGKCPWMAYVLSVFSVLCLLYCLAIGLFMGYGTHFFLIWGLLAIVLGVLAGIAYHRRLREKIPKWVKIAFGAVVTAGALLFASVEGQILSTFSATAQPGADYLIVLGAQWKANGPSYVLQKRLDKAVEYLMANPDTKVIVSGGQGANEPVSEAQGMYEYLAAAGIAPERILQEAASRNTRENLVFSEVFLDKRNDRVVLVTNNFHTYRALAIARKQGYVQVEGLSAGSYPAMLPNNLLREFFGVVKDFLMDNL